MTRHQQRLDAVQRALYKLWALHWRFTLAVVETYAKALLLAYLWVMFIAVELKLPALKLSSIGIVLCAELLMLPMRSTEPWWGAEVEWYGTKSIARRFFAYSRIALVGFLFWSIRPGQ